MLCCEFQVINKVYNTNLPIVKASQPLNGAGIVPARPMCKEMVNAALRQSVRISHNFAWLKQAGIAGF